MKELPPAARIYVVVVAICGAATAVVLFPRAPLQPGLFFFLLAATCLTSIWKVSLPIPVSNGSTLSVSYAADLMALLLLGVRPTIYIAAAGAWLQCAFRPRRPYPVHRTVFSIAAEIITMAATGLVYGLLGGTQPPFAVASLVKPIVAAIATYFVLNTGLVAIAIGLTTDRSALRVWREDFLWSGASFMVAGSAGAFAAIVIERHEQWLAILLLAPVFLTYRTYSVFVGRIDDERRHQARLEHALDETQAARAAAERANGLKDQFLATVSHELRTPLNAILGWADMLRTGSLPEDRRVQAYTAIFNNAHRQARLVEGLLDMARITSGKLRLDRSMIELRDVIGGALEAVQPAADAKQITITVEVPPDSVVLYADSVRLQQVLWNLLSNAVKFTPPGGAVRLRATASEGAREIVVQDTGDGIRPDFLPAVFEPFRQADPSSTRVHHGLGLGLAISRQLVEAHGGSICADSEGVGRGATFTVRLPVTTT